MKGGFLDIIEASIEWTKTILFRPFSLKKWMVFFFIALFASQLSVGFNGNVKFSANKADVAKARKLLHGVSPGAFIKNVYVSSVDKRGKGTTRLIIILGVGIIASLILLSGWLYSVFNFIYIEAVTENRSSIKAPFRRNLSLGNSYFRFNVSYLIAVFCLAVLLVKSGYSTVSATGIFTPGSNVAAGEVLAAAAPYALMAMAGFIISSLFYFFINDCVLVVMYKKRASVLKAVGPAFGLLKGRVLLFIAYMFIKSALSIAVGIISVIAGIFIILNLASVSMASALTVFFIFKALPAVLKPAFLIISAAIAVPAAVALVFLSSLLFLPFSIFYKVFNIKFISRLDEKYDLFKLYQAEGA